jgi:hypothetical protein
LPSLRERRTPSRFRGISGIFDVPHAHRRHTLQWGYAYLTYKRGARIITGLAEETKR